MMKGSTQQQSEARAEARAAGRRDAEGAVVAVVRATDSHSMAAVAMRADSALLSRRYKSKADSTRLSQAALRNP